MGARAEVINSWRLLWNWNKPFLSGISPATCRAVSRETAGVLLDYALRCNVNDIFFLDTIRRLNTAERNRGFRCHKYSTWKYSTPTSSKLVVTPSRVIAKFIHTPKDFSSHTLESRHVLSLWDQDSGG